VTVVTAGRLGASSTMSIDSALTGHRFWMQFSASPAEVPHTQLQWSPVDKVCGQILGQGGGVVLPDGSVQACGGKHDISR